MVALNIAPQEANVSLIFSRHLRRFANRPATSVARVDDLALLSAHVGLGLAHARDLAADLDLVADFELRQDDESASCMVSIKAVGYGLDQVLVHSRACAGVLDQELRRACDLAFDLSLPLAFEVTRACALARDITRAQGVAHARVLARDLVTELEQVQTALSRVATGSTTPRS